MNLISPLFLFLFLPIFLIIYIFSRQSTRLALVIIASLVFITIEQPSALWWLGGVLISGYVIARIIAHSSQNSFLQKTVFWIGIGINLILLFLFKYLNAYGPVGLDWLRFPLSWNTSLTGLTVPLGLSYFTFQMISYTVDVLRGKLPAEKNFAKLAAYLLFFPKIISGPIIRYKSFSDQLSQLNPSTETIVEGLRRFLSGFIKRTLIANQLAGVVNAVFNQPEPNLQPHFAWLALLAYTLQIYYDFSGYTDMAIGLGLMIGIRLPENFNLPYLAESISDFWRRWHATLTAWFREYVFYPLERRRFKWMGQQINIMIVFLLTGLWHGFSLTFIVWGLLHGIAMALESAGLGRQLKKIWRPVQHIYTLLIVLAGWVFFRSISLSFAIGFFRRLAGNTSGLTNLPFSQTTPLPFIEPSFILAMGAGILFCLPLASFWKQFRDKMEKRLPVSFFAFQITEDLLLFAFVVLGLAALLSSRFTPNIYAKF